MSETGGIFSGMKSHSELPTFGEVCDGVGDKVLRAMANSVLKARADLNEYRALCPQFAADATERGLANWIHDRMWKHLVDELDDVPEVNVVDNGVLREIRYGTKYKFRAKRHDEASGVRSFPTQMALDFHVQQSTLDGMEEVGLAYGYEWVAEERRIGSPVMSLHHKNQLIWSSILDTDESASGTPFAAPMAPTAGGPGISVDVVDVRKQTPEEQAK